MTTDTGFLKLFYSTRYLDLKRIEQPAAADGGRGARDAQVERLVLDAELWGALEVSVTMFTEEDDSSSQ
jgi:hypothetical protein